MTKLIILDRDGVINHDSDEYIKSVDEYIIYQNSLQAIALLKQQGYSIAIATNQSGIGRGYYGLQEMHAMHAKLDQALQPFNAKIDKICFCPHIAADNCNCRKPKPGMLLEILDHFQIPNTDRSSVCFVGDSMRDLQAAKAAGCKPVLVLTGYGKNTVAQLDKHDQTQCFEDLLDFVQDL